MRRSESPCSSDAGHVNRHVVVRGWGKVHGVDACCFGFLLRIDARSKRCDGCFAAGRGNERLVPECIRVQI